MPLPRALLEGLLAKLAVEKEPALGVETRERRSLPCEGCSSEAGWAAPELAHRAEEEATRAEPSTAHGPAEAAKRRKGKKRKKRKKKTKKTRKTGVER